DHVTAVALGQLGRVDTGNAQGDEHLDHQLVAGRGARVGGSAEPQVELVPAPLGDAGPPPGALLGLGLRPPHARPLRALAGRVHPWQVLTGHISPVPASNSWANWKPYFGPSLSRANSAWRTIIGYLASSVLLSTLLSTVLKSQPPTGRRVPAIQTPRVKKR